MLKVLFVCMGNICRSPSGEAVMNAFVEREGLQNKIECDSAGTIAHHEGERADSRMQRHAVKRGYDLTSIARQFKKNDFEKFDYIIAMDRSNYRNILALDAEGKYENKVFMMTDFAKSNVHDEVPDPYYGGPEGFETVLNILEDACEGLLTEVKNDL